MFLSDLLPLFKMNSYHSHVLVFFCGKDSNKYKSLLV